MSIQTSTSDTGMDVEKARFNMIEQQIRPWDVADSEVLGLLSSVKREDFVPAAYRGVAFADLDVPLSRPAVEGQCMLAPKVQARMLQDAAVESTDHVLHIGTGSGYMAALLGKQAKHVVTVEIDPHLADQARANLQHAGITNVDVFQADATAESFRVCRLTAPYEVIVLSGSVAEVPQDLLQMLAVGGRLVAIVGNEPIMRATVITRATETAFGTEQPWDYLAPRLLHFPQHSTFRF